MKYLPILLLVGCASPAQVKDLTPYGGPRIHIVGRQGINEGCKNALLNDDGKPITRPLNGCAVGDDLYVAFWSMRTEAHELCHWITEKYADEHRITRKERMKLRKMCKEKFKA